MKIVFMGTPDFALSALKALHEGEDEVVLAVTQPDRKKGRGGKVSVSPVKAYAVEQGIPVFQPERIRDEAAIETLRQCAADLYVVAAFGQILPKEVLDLPPKGCINIHASLLPKYRGAAPIQEALLNGEAETGITIMQMDEGCDTGDILLQKRLEILPGETAGELFDRLALLGADCLKAALPLIEAGQFSRIRQQDTGIAPSGTRKMTKETGRLDFTLDASYLARLVRAVTPWPGAYTSINGELLKVFSAQAKEEDTDARAAAGQILRAGDAGMFVQTGKGVLCIKEVQLAGRKRMPVRDFLRGYPLPDDTVLGA